MAKANASIVSLMPDEVIVSKIYHVRGHKVMLDRDLAEMYGMENKRMKEAVRRNMQRFPADFMFELTRVEYDSLRTQFASLKKGAHTKYLPFAFTEQGVSMLSGVLNSPIAVQVHIQIIRIFTRMREMLLTNKDILLKLEKMEKDVTENKQDIAMIFQALKQLLEQPKPKRRMIGFKQPEEDE